MISRSRNFVPWRLTRKIPPKRRLTQDLHSATSQKTIAFIVTAAKISNDKFPTYLIQDRNFSHYIPLGSYKFQWLNSSHLKKMQEVLNEQSLILLMTNSMEHKFSEHANSRSACQEIIYPLWNLKVHYCDQWVLCTTSHTYALYDLFMRKTMKNFHSTSVKSTSYFELIGIHKEIGPGNFNVDLLNIEQISRFMKILHITHTYIL
jgi:hypothetical protein